ncbi:uncharacterized protein LOC110901354 [Helianthus annuus]|uniref:uncharacterized protein LOC110901354 n=1 Tax=Helianthus annuus TaxID=4232 RepID=UPI00165328E9|nr:uncharacterized protein LOC110901354 [Helianthus annuus]
MTSKVTQKCNLIITRAERVKAKMKLQLSSTAKQDEANDMGSGWERFNFDKDAPLDDEEIEAAEDDGALVKHTSQTFRFSGVEAKREEKIKATHDEAFLEHHHLHHLWIKTVKETETIVQEKVPKLALLQVS